MRLGSTLEKLQNWGFKEEGDFAGRAEGGHCSRGEGTECEIRGKLPVTRVEY